MLARELQHPVREIIYRTSGQTHGPITRLMSPSDLGELLKPFVFLDLAGFDGRFAPTPMGFGWHPHSGIATDLRLPLAQRLGAGVHGVVAEDEVV